ncbi:MAG: superoxide dismutase [Verrucomicrobiales bacterium]
MKRRTFLTTATTAAAASVLQSQAGAATAPDFSLTLAPLPYSADALEPHVDAATMGIHHGKHHAAYLTNLTKALDENQIKTTDTLALIRDLQALPAAIQTTVRNNGGGHVNHTLFWRWMAPAGAGPAAPDGKLAEAIQTTFGGLDGFQKAFAEAAAKRFGSGWAWLIVKSDGKLAVTSTANQDNPWMKGIVPEAELGTPVLGLDVWEHAYYLNYQNRRADYITNWWKIVNWNFVQQNFDKA